MNARGEPSPVVFGWNEMTMAVDLTTELNLADLTNFAKDQWGFAFDQKGHEYSNKPYAVATIEKDLPKAFSVVLNDTLQPAQNREFDPKRQQWLQKGRASGWDNYTGISKGKGKGQTGRGSYQRHSKGQGHCGSSQPYRQGSQQQDQWYWSHATSSTKEATREGQPVRDTPREEAGVAWYYVHQVHIHRW